MENKIVFLPMVIFGVIFLVMILGFLGFVVKLVKKGRDSAWTGELTDKKQFENEDMDTGLKKDYFSLIFKTDEGKTTKVGVSQEIYNQYKIGDRAQKVKGEYHIKKLV